MRSLVIADRSELLEKTVVTCAGAAGFWLETAAATVEAPPVSAVAAIVGTASIASCIVLGVVTPMVDANQTAALNQASGYFDPFGLVGGTTGALIGGPGYANIGADVGGLLGSAFTFPGDFKDFSNAFSGGEPLLAPGLSLFGGAGSLYFGSKDLNQDTNDLDSEENKDDSTQPELPDVSEAPGAGDNSNDYGVEQPDQSDDDDSDWGDDDWGDGFDD